MGLDLLSLSFLSIFGGGGGFWGRSENARGGLRMNGGGRERQGNCWGGRRDTGVAEENGEQVEYWGGVLGNAVSGQGWPGENAGAQTFSGGEELCDFYLNTGCGLISLTHLRIAGGTVLCLFHPVCK